MKLAHVVLLGCLAFAGPVWAERAVVGECTIAAPGRVLCHELVVAAPLAEVWRLFSTAEGFSSWAAPVAAVDLRPGGYIESSYDLNARIGDGGNIRNRIVAVVPERQLAMQIAAAPPGFPHADEARELITTIELQPLGEAQTRVRVAMSGYGEGEAFDALYAFFARGNAWTLQKLNERVAGGPVNWREQAAGE